MSKQYKVVTIFTGRGRRNRNSRGCEERDELDFRPDQQTTLLCRHDQDVPSGEKYKVEG